MAMNPAAMSGMAGELSTMMRTLSDFSALGNMVGSLAGGGAGAGSSPFGIGQKPGGPGLVGIPQKLALNLGVGMPAGFATDVSRLGLQFAGKRNEQMVGQDILDTKERILGKGMNLLANPVSVKNVTAFGAELVNVIPTIEKWGKALLQNVDELAKFDASMAEASAITKLGEYQRTVSSAQVTGESSLDLAEGLEGLMNDLQPVKDAITIMLNDGMLVLVDVAKELLKYLSQFYDYVVDLAKSIGESLQNSYFTYIQAIGEKLEEVADYAKNIKEEVSRANRKPADQISIDFLNQIRQREAIARPVQMQAGVAGNFG